METSPKAKFHKPRKGVAAGDGRWKGRRGTKGKNKRGKRNPQTVRNKALKKDLNQRLKKRQAAGHRGLVDTSGTDIESGASGCTEVPSDQDEQLPDLEERPKAYERAKEERGEECKEDPLGLFGLVESPLPAPPRVPAGASNPTAASSRTVYVASQEETTTDRWRKVYQAKLARIQSNQQ